MVSALTIQASPVERTSREKRRQRDDGHKRQEAASEGAPANCKYNAASFWTAYP